MPKPPRRPFDDVVMRPTPDSRSHVDDDEDDDLVLELQPTDPETDHARRRIRERTAERQKPIEASPPPVPPTLQFSIRHLLIANVVIAVFLVLARLLIPQMIAGVLGVAAFLTLAAVQILQPEDERAYTISWALIGIYIVISAIAVFAP